MTPPSRQLFADVSSNNGEISVRDYSRAGHVLLMIKATEGNSYVNPLHAAQADAAHRYGLTVAHYGFADASSPGSVAGEASFLWTVAKHHWRGGDFLLGDFERGVSGLAGKDLSAYATAYCSILVRESKSHCAGAYASESWWFEYLSLAKVERHHVAYWSEPLASAGDWAHQYTDGTLGPEPHRFAGIGACDGSVLNPKGALWLALRKSRSAHER